MAAAPLYDFSDPAMKPWHLKATYQLYDYKGKPTEQGTFEYWWASPKVYRISTSRPSSSWTEWHTSEGKHLYLGIGETPKVFEGEIVSELFSPLPNQAALNPYKTRLDLEEKTSNGVKYSCIALNPSNQGAKENLPIGFEQTYCFDPQLPVLRIYHYLGTQTTEFNDIGTFQGKYLAREIIIFAGGQKVFSINTNSVNGITETDPALTPAPEATLYNRTIG